MDLLGLDNWQYLNGGIVPWIKEGFATESTINQPVSIEVNSDIEPCSSTRITANEIIENLDNSDFAVWDARSPGEYSGDMVRSSRVRSEPYHRYIPLDCEHPIPQNQNYPDFQ